MIRNRARPAIMIRNVPKRERHRSEKCRNAPITSSVAQPHRHRTAVTPPPSFAVIIRRSSSSRRRPQSCMQDKLTTPLPSFNRSVPTAFTLKIVVSKVDHH
jgi:hypothetical protein